MSFLKNCSLASSFEVCGKKLFPSTNSMKNAIVALLFFFYSSSLVIGGPKNERFSTLWCRVGEPSKRASIKLFWKICGSLHQNLTWIYRNPTVWQDLFIRLLARAYNDMDEILAVYTINHTFYCYITRQYVTTSPDDVNQ